MTKFNLKGTCCTHGAACRETNERSKLLESVAGGGPWSLGSIQLKPVETDAFNSHTRPVVSLFTGFARLCLHLLRIYGKGRVFCFLHCLRDIYTGSRLQRGRLLRTPC